MSATAEENNQVEEMQFGSEGDQNSGDSFDKQLQQQELELQSQIRQQELEDEARKAALGKQDGSVVGVPAPVPEPVAAPVSWQENHIPEDMAVEDTSSTNGTPTKSSCVDGAHLDSHITVGVKRSSPSPPTASQENGGEEDPSADDKQPSAKQRKLDEFAKLWNAVTENPKDFQAWTMLLQHVDQQSELESGREAYGAFFARYPYCFGYWKKFADLEKRKGTKDTTLKVFERGLSAIPLSVDLWVHYLDYITNTYSESDQHAFVRLQFERAVLSCGLEFKSDKMWDAYINWENNNKRLQRVTAVYDRLLATPVAKYLQHWNKFQDHIKHHQAHEVISGEEFLSLRRSLLAPDQVGEEGVAPGVGEDEAPPGVEDDADIAAAEGVGASAAAAVTVENEEENKNIQQLIISVREKIHQSTMEEVKVRHSYEDAIKRPYFHVKPLERSQLQAWRDYLEFEQKQGNETRTRTLFERCLIAAALYEEFWMRYVHYLETLSTVTVEEMRCVYERACNIHLKEKLKPHLSWANFEEEKGNADRALELLLEIQTRLPDALEPHLQAVALERRRGNLEQAEHIFGNALELFKGGKAQKEEDKEKTSSTLTLAYTNLLVKYARFLSLFRNNSKKAVEMLQNVVDESISSADAEPNNTVTDTTAFSNDVSTVTASKQSDIELQCQETLLWALVERALSCTPPHLEAASKALRSGTSAHYSPRTRMVFAHRYHQFVMECGAPGVSVSDSTKLLRELQNELRQLESSQEEVMDDTTSEKTGDTSMSAENRRDRRGNKSHSSSYNSERQQQQAQLQQPPPMSHSGHHQNGGNISGSGGGPVGSGHGGGGYGGGGNYLQYPPQNSAVPPPHQPPQHPPPPQGHQGYGSYNQNYQQQGYSAQQYQGWGYPQQQQQQQQQQGYGYNQQGWAGYPNYYGQR